MATQTSSLTLPARSASRSAGRLGQATSSLLFDRVYVVMSAWLLGGLFVDGWAHVNLRNLETFFTPWHGLFYSGFFAVLVVLGVGIGRGRQAGFSGWRAIPAGYELSAVGAALFTVGGVLDMLWHIVFGIEADLDALLSPTHLLLATGLALLFIGPARAAWRRAASNIAQVPDGWRAQLPMLLSLLYVFGLFTFFTQYLHPLSSAWAISTWRPGVLGEVINTAGGHELEVPFLFQAPMMAGLMLHSALLVGVLLFASRYARLPRGSVVLFIVPVTLLTIVMRTRYALDAQASLAVAVLIAGVLGELLLGWLRPSASRPLALRVFAALVPVVVYGTYFVVLLATTGLWWTVHLWVGAIFLAGVVGWLVALLATSQPAPAQLAVGTD